MNQNPTPPPLIEFSGEWSPYEEKLYEVFRRSLLQGEVFFKGVPVWVRRHPEYKGKHFAFWHLISEGETEEERTPDFRRCERLEWVAWVIMNCNECADIDYWENKRKSQKHTVIWYESENYVVVLAQRKNYFLLKTAYLAAPHRAQSLEVDRRNAKTRKARIN